MLRHILVSSALFFGFAGTGFAQSLYIGEQEFDTEHRGVMGAIVERCAELAAEEDDAAAAAALTRAVETGDEPAAVQQPSRLIAEGETTIDREMLVIDVSGLASGDGGMAPAGEGADAGAPPAEDSGGQEQTDLSALTLQSCREAGIVH
jgi:hypothetical protein